MSSPNHEPRPNSNPQSDAESQDSDDDHDENPCETSFHGTLQVFSWVPTINQQTDLGRSINQPRVEKILGQELSKKGPIKWYISVKVRFAKVTPEGEVFAEPFFTSRCYLLVNAASLQDQFQEALQKLLNDCESFIRNGSGWVMDKVLKVFVNVGQYKPLKGKSYIPLPQGLSGNNHGIINIQNTDHKCFLWSILAALHPSNTNPQRVNQYLAYEHDLNVDGISMPMKLEQVKKFEKQNQISICIFGYDKGVYPLHISQHRFPTHVNLLLISKGSTQHYCLIKDLNRLLSHQNKHSGKTHFCPYCLHGFIRGDLLQNHLLYCKHHSPQRVEMPSEADKWLKFNKHAYQLRVPFVIYCDLESLLTKVDSCDPDPSKSSTSVVDQHIPCGFCYRVVSTNNKYSKPAILYRGPDAAGELIKALQREGKEILDKLKHIEPMKLRVEDEIAFQNATHCHICSKPLGADRVRDHDHLKQGFNYRGAAHNACNLNFKHPSYIPVIFHNLRGYDGHLLLSAISGSNIKRISCIPNNMEKYISFSIGNLRFIDSLQFLNS